MFAARTKNFLSNDCNRNHVGASISSLAIAQIEIATLNSKNATSSLNWPSQIGNAESGDVFC